MHVMQGPDTIGRTTSHEIGHMWFYGIVGNNQGRDPWLDEGMATYAEARFLGNLSSFTGRSIPSDARGRAGEPMTYWEAHPSSYYRGVYVQGAQAVAALGAPDLVDCALRQHVARNAHRIATSRDAIDAIRTVFADAEATLARYGIASR
jgi:aminopeptidase N